MENRSIDEFIDIIGNRYLKIVLRNEWQVLLTVTGWGAQFERKSGWTNNHLPYLH